MPIPTKRVSRRHEQWKRKGITIAKLLIKLVKGWDNDMDIVIQAGLFIVGFAIGVIWWTWILEPKKSVIEGLKDWWHESDDDI